MPSAIVTGATGILGREIVHALGKDPRQWQTVHALSRSQKENYPSNVKHDTIDLTNDAKGMAKQLEGVEAEYRASTFGRIYPNLSSWDTRRHFFVT